MKRPHHYGLDTPARGFWGGVGIDRGEFNGPDSRGLPASRPLEDRPPEPSASNTTGHGLAPARSVPKDRRPDPTLLHNSIIPRPAHRTRRLARGAQPGRQDAPAIAGNPVPATLNRRTRPGRRSTSDKARSSVATAMRASTACQRLCHGRGPAEGSRLHYRSDSSPPCGSSVGELRGGLGAFD